MQQFNTFIRANLSADDNEIFNASFAIDFSQSRRLRNDRNCLLKLNN